MKGMACLVKKSHAHSPESTVSSLLASCNLNSSGDSSDFHNSVQYKDKLYSSASQALEAYIEDFDRSLASPALKPGKIYIAPSSPKDFRHPEDNFKHKHARGNFKQQETLASFVPYVRRKTDDELDVFSLTTDDLLTFPADGSVSFTQNGAWRTPRRTSSLNKKALVKPASHACHQAASFGRKELSFANSSLYREASRRVDTTHTFSRQDPARPVEGQLTEQENSKPASHQNYPRWLTSQKTDLSISGISSIPEFKYPIWLRSHHLLSDSSNENSVLPQELEGDSAFLQENKNLVTHQMMEQPIASGYAGKDDLLELQCKQDVLKSLPDGVPPACFTAQPFKDQKHLFQDDGTVSLLQEVRRTLESSAEELNTPLKNDGSPCTVDILEAERSWDNVPVGLRTPVPVCCDDDSVPSPKANIVNGFLEDCLKNSSQESTFSGGNHHGPVEALKLMLFNLQAVQRSFSQNKTDGQKGEFKKTSDEDWELKLCDSDMVPIKQSLQRALHHLSRLKCLVEDTSSKEELKEFQDTKRLLS